VLALVCVTPLPDVTTEATVAGREKRLDETDAEIVDADIAFGKYKHLVMITPTAIDPGAPRDA
jgi:hypothetical protein